MIYLTGDTHGRIDRRFEKLERFVTKRDYLIICGDFGFVWYDEHNIVYPTDLVRQKQYLEYLKSLPCKVLWVDGNHENFDLLGTFPVKRWHGGEITVIADNVFHLRRGYVFTIEGKTFLTMGGACSTDKNLRTPHYSWWSAEVPNSTEWERCSQNLAKINNTVDFVISHACPYSILQKVHPEYTSDLVTEGLDRVKKQLVKFKWWYCGHYHEDVICNSAKGNFMILYYSIAELGKDKFACIIND